MASVPPYLGGDLILAVIKQLTEHQNYVLNPAHGFYSPAVRDELSHYAWLKQFGTITLGLSRGVGHTWAIQQMLNTGYPGPIVVTAASDSARNLLKLPISNPYGSQSLRLKDLDQADYRKFAALVVDFASGLAPGQLDRIYRIVASNLDLHPGPQISPFFIYLIG